MGILESACWSEDALMSCTAGALWGQAGPSVTQAPRQHIPPTAHSPSCPPGLGTEGCPVVQCLFFTQQLLHKVRRELVGMLRHAGHKLQAINASSLIPILPQGNPEQDTNILSDFTSFPFWFFQHNHIHWFLLVCRSCLQLEAQNTIYFLYGFLIWKWI